MATEISQIRNERLQEIAKRADKNNDGKLKRNDYSLFVKEAQAQGVDYKEINEALEMNGFQRWWHDVDKISTDGNDDGKLSFKEGSVSFLKGLLGGIPKAIIEHPIASAVTIGVGAGLVALTGGAILPVLTAFGIATGVGMIGVGTYKALTAEKDGDAKQALETMGTGVATTVLSMLSAGKALSKAEQAGVKSAHVAEDANIFQKSVQVFKAIPESLKMSKQWAMSYIKGTPINIELANGTKQVKVKGKLVEERLPDGTHTYVGEDSRFKNIDYPDGSKKVLYSNQIVEERLPNGETTYSYHKLKRTPKGSDIRTYSDGTTEVYYPNHRCIIYNHDGSIKSVDTWSYSSDPLSATFKMPQDELTYIEGRGWGKMVEVGPECGYGKNGYRPEFFVPEGGSLSDNKRYRIFKYWNE